MMFSKKNKHSRLFLNAGFAGIYRPLSVTPDAIHIVFMPCHYHNCYQYIEHIFTFTCIYLHLVHRPNNLWIYLCDIKKLQFSVYYDEC